MIDEKNDLAISEDLGLCGYSLTCYSKKLFRPNLQSFVRRRQTERTV